MKTSLLLLVALLLVSSGCSREPQASDVARVPAAPVVARVPPGPDVIQLQKDLIGQSFFDDGRRTDITSIEDLDIQERRTDSDAKTEEIRVMATVTDTGGLGWGPARGILVVGYKHFDQGWKVQSVESKGEFVSTR